MSAVPKKYIRFTLAQRIEHLAQLVSFTILAITGLPQKYDLHPVSQAIIALFGGIETARLIHRAAAIVLMVATVYHLIAVAYKLYVRRVRPTMLPVVKDATDAWRTFLYNLGLSRQRPQLGRYTFEEKAEYWAFVWGTVIMVITGFMLWNPIATAAILPGQFIPAALAAHGGEAVLAVLAIIVWHMYGVHLRHFNKSMFIGTLTEEEMRHEHPLELADIKAGVAQRPLEPAALKQRQRSFAPVAGIASVALLAGVYWFVTFEQTAITTLPPQPTVQAFVPQTPTPFPPTRTPPPVGELTWNGYFAALFAAKCADCHGTAGGLSVASYEEALAGGRTGRAVVPGDPEASLMVSVQQAEHPATFSEVELNRLIEWIRIGAPQN